jgi:Zinc finger, C3HC4 type (RING finger)
MEIDSVSVPKDLLICSICFEVPKYPIECVQCSQLFCLICIYEWFNKSQNYYCPLRCDFGSLRQTQGALKRIIDSLTSTDTNIQHNKNCTQDMDIVKETTIDWGPILRKRNKMWIKAAENWLLNVYKPI